MKKTRPRWQVRGTAGMRRASWHTRTPRSIIHFRRMPGSALRCLAFHPLLPADFMDAAEADELFVLLVPEPQEHALEAGPEGDGLHAGEDGMRVVAAFQ